MQAQQALAKTKPQEPAPTQPVQAQAQIKLPSSDTMLILIRSSVLALNQANITDNYTVLNALGSRNFQAINPPSRLENLFQWFRANHFDLSPVVMINPQLTAQPSLINGRMRLVGMFPSKPLQVNFDLTFEPDEGKWKILGLGVNLSATPQPAPKPAPPPPISPGK